MASKMFHPSPISFLLALALTLASYPSAHQLAAPPCEKVECPSFDLLDNGLDFQIRRYNASLWMSTAELEDVSFVNATRTGFLELFQYIQGKNKRQTEVPMTAPVLTGILPSDGPFCASTFLVRFYVPKAFQVDPPLPEEDLQLHVDRWGSRCFAVRKFGGFVRDTDIAEEAAKLEASLAETPWGGMISRRGIAETEESYLIAQYNSPFEFSARLNEVWLQIHGDTSNSQSSLQIVM